RYYAQSWQQGAEKKLPRWGVLLDMVGDKDLGIRVPVDSPAPLVASLYAAADDIELRKYFGMGSQIITDDHKPLNDAGIPTIDIIDMDYSFWHTPGDTKDKLSVESLETVGKVTLLMIEKYLLDKSVP
ncbi:MAG: M28 family peptidase, partial [Verrucomicrobia bacterium]|nr:M28 family peptidase [Verrucomicrobiota bacterium]